ncbi:MAG: hypothetical protein HOQ32_05400 [Lysobacter sp.]|nr:hypothetical protein [Lysobacter sp.]
MNANDVIESYVADVATRLPRKQRNDVAYELRALIDEGLQDRAEETGREADADMAVAFLRQFGRPDEVAARYRPQLSIIDPADGHAFLRATAIGMAIIWILGLLEATTAPGSTPIRALAQWWTGAVLPSLWWPGVLVVSYAIAGWVRRRRPQAAQWTPRSADRIHGGRVGMAMATVAIACGLWALMEPTRVLDLAFGGRAAPVAYQAMTYTDAFRQGPAPWLFGLLALYLPLFAFVAVRGRWSPLLRRAESTLALLVCAAMLWVLVSGPVLMAPHSDRTMKVLMALVLAFSLIAIALEARGRINPAPDRPKHS